MGNQAIVGGMVVFEYALPKKSEYRKFKMKYSLTQDDYQSMKEMIYRRFSRAAKEEYENISQEKSKFLNMPNLIFIDGGIGHVNAVSQMLKELDIKIPVFGLAKNKNHRVSRIVSIGGEILLKPNVAFWPLIGKISDEVHRYTISYHKKIRTNKSFESRLDNIKGLGTVKRQALFEKFKSVENIKNATVEQLAQIKGITPTLAHNIKTKLAESEKNESNFRKGKRHKFKNT
jgi:excinuclease ABC subunit C